MSALWVTLFFLTAGLESTEHNATASHHRRFVVGISPFLQREAKDDVFRALVRLLVEEVPLDSSFAIYDAYHIRSITEVNVPNLRVFESPKTRANQFAPAIQSLKGFLAKDFPKRTNAHLRFDGTVRLPQFEEFLDQTVSSGTDSPVATLLIGSPLYEDAKEPAFSMADGYFPSDGHLLATSDNSVYGCNRPTNAVGSLLVDWVYFGDPWLNDLHREKVTRFWTLFLERRGGKLGSLSSDLPAALRGFTGRSANRDALAGRWKINPQQTKLEMLRVSRTVDVSDWISRETVAEPAQGPPASMLGKMRIGIRWQAAIDLDLYATPRPRAETLFFEHPRSPEGSYYKDHRSSPGKEFEFIEFETPVDIRQVEAEVNFYEGFCPGGPRGEVRIEFEGRIYTEPFTIAASRGNLGRTGPSQQKFWTRIPVQQLLRIEAAAHLTEAPSR